MSFPDAPWPSIAADRPVHGWRPLLTAPGEPHDVRTDVGGVHPQGRLRGITALLQVSDLHVTDAQSPARAEFLDRLGDDDSPVRHLLGPLGTYRPQEPLTAQVVEAMCRRLRQIGTGPVTGAPVTFAVSTGDAADNAQANEVEASIQLMIGGGEVRPDSGDPTRWEGVGSPAWYDQRYWHPDGTPDGERVDRPRERFGFPVVPGLLDAARAPFQASGLGVPWYPVHGNHDRLLAGTVTPPTLLARLARSRHKPSGMPPGLRPGRLVQLLGGSEHRDLDLLPPLACGPTRPVTADAGRGIMDLGGWLAAHVGRSALPVPARTAYGFDVGDVRMLVLDTVDAEGGWQGSLDEAQLRWLEEELRAASDHWVEADGRRRHRDGAGRPVVLFSHHPLRCLVNDWSPRGERRVLAPQVEAVLCRYPALAAWVNGHTHAHRVVPHRRHPSLTGGWWEVTTASHVDWPQQARVIELAVDGAGQLVLAATVVDHTGALEPSADDLGEVAHLAGWSRWLAANDWQRAGADGTVAGRGGPEDRNVVLVCAGAPLPRPVMVASEPASSRA